MNKIISLVLTLLMLSLGVILGVLNPHVVRFDAFVAIYQLPLSLLLAISFVLGALLAVLALSSKIMFLNWKLRKQLKLNAQQADSLVQLNQTIKTLQSSQAKSVSSNQIINLNKE